MTTNTGTTPELDRESGSDPATAPDSGTAPNPGSGDESTPFAWTDPSTWREVGGVLLLTQGTLYFPLTVGFLPLLFMDLGDPDTDVLLFFAIAGVLGLPTVAAGVLVFRGRYGGGALFVGNAYSAPFFFVSLGSASLFLGEQVTSPSLAIVVFLAGTLLWLATVVASVVVLATGSIPEGSPRLFRRDPVGSTLWMLGWRPGTAVSSGVCLAAGVSVFLYYVSAIDVLSTASVDGFELLVLVAGTAVAPLACGTACVAREYHPTIAAYRDLADRRRTAYRREVDAPTEEVEAYTLIDSGKGVLFLGPDRRYRTTHVLVGPDRLWVVEDFTFDVTTGELRFENVVRRAGYDQTTAVTSRKSTFVLRTDDGTYEHPCREDPGDVIAAIDDRLRCRDSGRGRVGSAGGSTDPVSPEPRVRGGSPGGP